MIANTTSDLDGHLAEIDSKLQVLSSKDTRFSEEQQQLQEEQDSAQQCLNICAQVSIHIDEVLPNTFKNISTPSGAMRSSLTSAQLATAQSFTALQETIADRTTWLKKHVEDIDNRLKSLPAQPLVLPKEYAAEQESILEEINSVKQCLAICEHASKRAGQKGINVMEDVSIAEDGQQVIVSTIGDLISAKRVTAGNRSIQLLGQMSDASLQQLFKNPRS